jgi:hypothetical protein
MTLKERNKMKKQTIAVLVAMLFAGTAFAQSAPVLPTTATPPTMLTVSPNAVSALLDPTTNSIFIDQSGISPTVNMTQIGAGNKAGTSADPVYLRGGSQVITTIQQGDNNVIDKLVIVTNGSSGTTAPSVAIRQIGDSNTADVACDTTAGCSNLDLNHRFTGDTNSMIFRASGADIVSHVDVSGSGNAFNILATGNKHSQVVSVSGDNNIFNLTQTSSGSNGSSIQIAQTGTGASFTVQQSGSVDNVLRINSVANGGSFSIIQRN